MKKIIVAQTILFSLITVLTVVSPIYAVAGDVVKVQSFIQSVIQTLTTIAGLIASGFFVWGGIGYITSSGNPEVLDRSKKTILYSAIGLVIVLGAFVISNVVSQTAGTSFGTSTTVNP
jgi:hypothetical protein